MICRGDHIIFIMSSQPPLFLIRFPRLPQHQAQAVQVSPVFSSRGFDVNPGGFDAAVAQDVCQPGDVFFKLIEAPGKKVAQAMGIDLGFFYLCCFTDLLQHAPDIAAIQGLSAAAPEDDAGPDLLLFHIFFQ